MKTGYDPSKKGYFYIIELWRDNEIQAYKVGITNRPPFTRHREIQRGSSFDRHVLNYVVSCENGQRIRDIEGHILKSDNITRNYPSRGYLEDGHYEIFNAKDGLAIKEALNLEIIHSDDLKQY